MTGQPIGSIVSTASPTPTRDVDGLPTWAKSERYDVTAKPSPHSTRDQISRMWRTMFADRMKLSAHVEEREQNTFALVLASSDGKLGRDGRDDDGPPRVFVEGTGGRRSDRTSLTGSYSLELRFAPSRSGGAADPGAAPDDAPVFLTALREQLGLKLLPQKSKVPVLVIDHIERPSEN